MSSTAEGDWNENVDRLYESVGNEGRLAEALGRFRPLVGAKASTFMIAGGSRANDSVHIAACDVPAGSLVEYHSHYFQHDEWVKGAFAKGAWKVDAAYTGSDLCQRSVLKASYFWRDFLQSEQSQQ